MNLKLLDGEEALAWGAISAGVKLATGYPGSPGTGVMNCLLENATNYGIVARWSVNEKVATEVAIGASMAGTRAMVCVKNVGINAMIDPLMALNLTPINGGLLFVVGDDPGAYGSQNDQDSRPLVNLLEMPWIEPAHPEDGYHMIYSAFSMSEDHRLPVFVRITRSYGVQQEQVSVKPPGTHQLPLPEFAHDRFVPGPSNAVEKHHHLKKALHKIAPVVTERYSHTSGRGTLGIVVCGHMHAKLLEVLNAGWEDKVTLFKLGAIYPIQCALILQTLDHCDQLVIIEEHHCLIEKELRAFVQLVEKSVSIKGRLDGFFSGVGEFYRWQLTEGLSSIDEQLVNQKYKRGSEMAEKPQMTNHCLDCRYDEVLDLLDQAAVQARITPYYIADPGCMAVVMDRIHAKYAMGGAAATASGFRVFAKSHLPIALFGDSSFFHSEIPAICDSAEHSSDFVMILLDNGSAKTTGGQTHPGVGEAALSMTDIVKACGVSDIVTLELGCSDQVGLVSQVFGRDGLRLIVITIKD